MNAETLNRFCAVLELDYVEQGMSAGIKGAWFQTRKRERKFYTEDEVQAFTNRVRTESGRHAATFTSPGGGSA
jgi:hypothetical protein